MRKQKGKQVLHIPVRDVGEYYHEDYNIVVNFLKDLHKSLVLPELV